MPRQLPFLPPCPLSPAELLDQVNAPLQILAAPSGVPSGWPVAAQDAASAGLRSHQISEKQHTLSYTGIPIHALAEVSHMLERGSADIGRRKGLNFGGELCILQDFSNWALSRSLYQHESEQSSISQSPYLFVLLFLAVCHFDVQSRLLSNMLGFQFLLLALLEPLQQLLFLVELLTKGILLCQLSLVQFQL